MIDRILWALVPACITFGPLFMTRIAGTASGDVGNHLFTYGVLMLVAGLAGIFRIISSQQKIIRKLETQLGQAR